MKKLLKINKNMLTIMFTFVDFFLTTVKIHYTLINKLLEVLHEPIF